MTMEAMETAATQALTEHTMPKARDAAAASHLSSANRVETCRRARDRPRFKKETKQSQPPPRR